MHAEITVLKYEPREYIYVHDIGHNRVRSVTNDAEYIVSYLFDKYGITDKTRIFYKDSQGKIDEIRHAGRKLIGFLAGHKGIPLERYS